MFPQACSLQACISDVTNAYSWVIHLRKLHFKVQAKISHEDKNPILQSAQAMHISHLQDFD